MMIIFYEKLGCQNNSKQKKLLQAHGLQLQVRNLLTENWTAEKLRPFFALKPVHLWFNPAAPQIKNGELDPKAFNETQALQNMIANPILIRRPLIQYHEFYTSGFDWELLIDALQIQEAVDLDEDIVSCKHGADDHSHDHGNHDVSSSCKCQQPHNQPLHKEAD